jgi:hypothetical protein
MSVEQILKKEKIIKYKGKLIFPDEDGTSYWFMSIKRGSLVEAREAVDNFKKRGIKVLPKKYLKSLLHI